MFLFIDEPALVCGCVNFPILWPHAPVQTKLKCAPPPPSPGYVLLHFEHKNGIKIIIKHLFMQLEVLSSLIMIVMSFFMLKLYWNIVSIIAHCESRVLSENSVQYDVTFR